MNLNSLDAVATQPKNFLNLLEIFCLVSEKNICTPPFFDAQKCILEALESKCPFISVYIRKKRHCKILSDGSWVGGKAE